MEPKSAIVLTIPHGGTHFAVMLLQLMGVEVEYCHFQPQFEDRIRGRLENIQEDERVILTHRNEEAIHATWKNRLEAKGADWFGSRLEEYDGCWETYDKLSPLLDEVGFFTLPIVKSASRFDLCDALRAYLNVGNFDIPTADKFYPFVMEWPRVKSWDPSKKDWRDENPKQLAVAMGRLLLKEKENA